jgi:hypothetical protein
MIARIEVPVDNHSCAYLGVGAFHHVDVHPTVCMVSNFNF